MFLFFFFFKQKTAYEMRISDWSSDVCSSDLSTACGLQSLQYVWIKSNGRLYFDGGLLWPSYTLNSLLKRSRHIFQPFGLFKIGFSPFRAVVINQFGIGFPAHKNVPPYYCPYEG